MKGVKYGQQRILKQLHSYLKRKLAEEKIEWQSKKNGVRRKNNTLQQAENRPKPLKFFSNNPI